MVLLDKYTINPNNEISVMELLDAKVVYLLKKANKGKRRSNLYNDIGIFTSKDKIIEFLQEIKSDPKLYKTIAFTLNRSRYHI